MYNFFGSATQNSKIQVWHQFPTNLVVDELLNKSGKSIFLFSFHIYLETLALTRFLDFSVPFITPSILILFAFWSHRRIFNLVMAIRPESTKN